MLDWCNIMTFYHNFDGLKLSYIFLFQRLLYKKLDTVKENIC